MRAPVTNFADSTSKPLSVSGFFAFAAMERIPASRPCRSIESGFAAFMCDGREHDFVDELADQPRRFGAAPFIGQGFAQLPGLLSVEARHLRVNEDRFILAFGKLRFQFGLAAFELDHPILDARGRHAVHDRLDQPVKFALGLRQRVFRVLAVRVALGMELVHMAG